MCRKAKGVEILSYGHNRKEVVMMLVGRGRESGFDEFACYRNWVVGLVMQTSRYGREDV